MDVPVSVLGDVSGDTPAHLAPGEALVLVGEDVAAVAPQVLWKVNIGLSFLQQREGLRIVWPDIPCYVVVHDVLLVRWHPAAHSLLERRTRTEIGDTIG